MFNESLPSLTEGKTQGAMRPHDTSNAGSPPINPPSGPGLRSPMQADINLMDRLTNAIGLDEEKAAWSRIRSALVYFNCIHHRVLP
jgi:hypothetical protein